MSQESHIDTRTPEEMYQQAFTRITAIGNAVIEANGWKHDYVPLMQSYLFDFDKKSKYHYHGKSKDGFFHYFRRSSDFAKLTMTKYSTPPKEVE